MQIVTISVGLPREIIWKGNPVTTGIFKTPVAGRVHLRRLNLDGDGQADLSVHGGADKAVYVYPLEHYDFWRSQGVADSLPHGSFGENLTTTGLLEDTVHIGDRFRVGTAEVIVTQPRLPCYKLGIKFGDPKMVKRFADSRRTGFYFAVLREGEVEAGHAIEVIHRDEHRVRVADITRLYLLDKNDVEPMRRAMEVEALPEGWRGWFAKRISGQPG